MSTGRMLPIVLLVAFALTAMPVVARAAKSTPCPGLAVAQATQISLEGPMYGPPLKGAAAERHAQRYQAAIAQAQPCLSKGTSNDRALALRTISQLHYIQAYILTRDGVPADRTKGIAIAQSDAQAVTSFLSSHSLSSQSKADLRDQLHRDDVMIHHTTQACYACDM